MEENIKLNDDSGYEVLEIESNLGKGVNLLFAGMNEDDTIKEFDVSLDLTSTKDLIVALNEHLGFIDSDHQISTAEFDDIHKTI